MTKRFAVINSTDRVHNIVISDDPLHVEGVWVELTGVVPEPGIGWSYVDGVFAPPIILEASPEQPVLRIITKAEMMARFTDDEFVDVLVKAKRDIKVEAWLMKFNAAATVDLDDARTISGIDLLVSKLVLTQERATAILTGPVQPAERP
jgi:hypothetical protein